MNPILYLSAMGTALLTSCGASSPSASDASDQTITNGTGGVTRNEKDKSEKERFAEHFKPITEGPLTFNQLFSVNQPSSPFTVSAPSLSPDGSKYFSYDGIRGLWFDSVTAKEPPHHLEGRLAAPSFGYSESIPFAWASDSSAIFGARQATADPSGFALAPMSTYLISPLGQARKLPDFKDSNGRLDSILWVGGEGLALAEFDTQGDYYRPERPNNRPTVAMVNGLRGRVLQAIRLPSSGPNELAIRTGAISAHIDNNGRLYALFVLRGRRWVEWRQGKPPRAVPLNTGDLAIKWFTVTSDSRRVLIMHNLSATGIICEHNPSCPPPKAQTGVVADLRDIKTGETIWSIEATANQFSNAIKPAISPDNCYALLLVPQTFAHDECIALISMESGKILQRLPSMGTSSAEVSFSPDGRQALVSARGMVAVYKF